MVARQFFERQRQFGVPGFGQRFGGGIGALLFGGGGEHVAKFLHVQRFLRGEQQRFENEFEFHFKSKWTGILPVSS